METLSFIRPAEAPRDFADFDRQFIGGQWRHGRSERLGKDNDPFTGETLVEIPQANRADLDEAYLAATKAQPAWGNAARANAQMSCAAPR